MPEYDFHQLSPLDLEVLARDLIQAEWKITFETFKTGKDSGIDLRHATAPSKIVVQCKHYVRTGLAGLLRDLKKEAVKVRRLGPTRYVLVTSVPLSPANKTEIIDVIGADVLASGDVIGQEGLNNLLGKYPEIEGKHFKLWLASRAVLDRVLHNAAVTQSEFKIQQVYREARRYVQSSAYHRALSMLGEKGLVILSGPPGVGKTTLANLLLYQHLEQGYRAVLIQRDIKEGQTLFMQAERQVFYFDDFLGVTFLSDRAALNAGNNDRALLEFIAMVRATPTSRLILTTREHIYSQAIDKSERLRYSELDGFRVFLRMKSYSFAQKTRILYNHLYFSDLPSDYQDELLRDGFYLKIIKHEKFNPRLIEWLSSFRRVRNIRIGQYRSFVGSLLSDPSEIWRHAYEQEISDAGRSMLLTIFSESGKVAGITLPSLFAALHTERARRYRFTTRPEDFRSALREVAGAFIKPWGKNGVEFIDPSVLDLLNAVVRGVPDNAVDIIAGAESFDQVEGVWSFAKAANGRPVATALRDQADRLLEPVRRCMLEERRVDLGHGAIGYRGATFERRLAIIIDMADWIPGFTDLIEPMSARLLDEWRSESPELNDAVLVLKALDRSRSMSESAMRRLRDSMRPGLVARIRGGYSSDELRELISVLDTPGDAADPLMAATLSGFEVFRRSYFAEDLRECKSPDQFDGLLEDLKLFNRELGVEVESLVERVEAAKVEFEDDEEARADHMQDDWKERWRSERADERKVSEMFDTLRIDRE